MNWSIKNKILIPTILMAVIGVGALSTISYYKAKDALKTAISGQVEQSAISALKTLETWLADRTLDLKGWSDQQIFVTSLKTSFIAKTARKSSNVLLMEIKKDYTYFDSLGLADQTGLIVSASNPDVIGKLNVAEWSSFKEAIEGNVSVSKVIQNKQTGAPVFIIAMPIKENDLPVGVLLGTLDINTYSKKFIDPIKVGKHGYAFIYDESGLVISHPVQSNVMKLNLNTLDFGKRMLDQKNGVIEYTYDGKKKSLHLATLRKWDGQSLCLQTVPKSWLR